MKSIRARLTLALIAAGALLLAVLGCAVHIRARADSAHAGLGLALAAEIARLLGVHLTSTLDANTVLTTRVSWSDAD